jgi:hypothetical protein
MEVDPTSPGSSQSFTILRIKRKRNEDPLDALGKQFSILMSQASNKGGEKIQLLNPLAVRAERNVEGWMSFSLRRRWNRKLGVIARRISRYPRFLPNVRLSYLTTFFLA